MGDPILLTETQPFGWSGLQGVFPVHAPCRFLLFLLFVFDIQALSRPFGFIYTVTCLLVPENCSPSFFLM